MASSQPIPYNLLADLVLVLHMLVVIFIVGGQVLVLVGAALRWQWIRNFRFRFLHLAVISFVVLLSWLEMFCPLTTLEMNLRARGGEAVYPVSFVAHWLQRLLYYDVPIRVLSLCYTLFGLTVVLAWILVPPYSQKKQGSGRGEKGSWSG
ncbi:MAG: hypothetical protein Kow0089_19720 [Desulfobulbaceae bacterium]